MTNYHFTEGQFRRLNGLFRQERAGITAALPARIWSDVGLVVVKMKQDLDSCDDPSEPTEATGTIWRDDEEEGFQETDEEIKIKNYFDNFSAAEDEFIWVIKKTHWMPVGGGGGGFQKAVLKAGGSISGRSGKTPGQGTVTLEKFKDDKIEELEKTVTCYNNFKSEIDTESDEDEDEEPQDMYIQMCKADGKWWVISVDCTKDEEDS